MCFRQLFVAVLSGAVFAADICVLQREAKGEFWRFLPGDAFFLSELTQELVTAMERDADGTVKLLYNPRRGPDLCSGYGTLEINGVSLKQRQLLAAVYRRVRKQQRPVFEITTTDSGEVRRELNGMALLIYNKTFDSRDYNIGLRYNENWVEDERNFGVPIVSYPELERPPPPYIVEDWCNSKLVPALKAVLPVGRGKFPHELQFTPVTVESRGVKFVVVMDDLLEDLRMNKMYAWCYVLEDDKVTRLEHDPDGWLTKDVEFEPVKDASP